MEREVSQIEATYGTWTTADKKYTIRCAYHDSTTVRLTDSNKETIIATHEEWFTRLDAMKDHGMYKV